jgi:hypothetical protein
MDRDDLICRVGLARGRPPAVDQVPITDLPDGASPVCKIFRFIVMATQCMVCPSHPIEGRFAVVTNAVWDAVDAERATDEGTRSGR